MVDTNDLLERALNGSTIIVKTPRVANDQAELWVDEIRKMPNGEPNPTHGWLKCKSGFNRNFIDMIKITIPWQDRRFVQSDKTWAVSPRFATALVNIASSIYSRVSELQVDPHKLAAVALEDVRGKDLDDLKSRLIEKSQQSREVLEQFGERKVEV